MKTDSGIELPAGMEEAPKPRPLSQLEYTFMMIKAQMTIRDMNPKTAAPVLMNCDKCPEGHRAHCAHDGMQVIAGFRSMMVDDKWVTMAYPKAYLCRQHRQVKYAS